MTTLSSPPPNPKRVSTVTWEPGAREPVLGLRPPPERYPVPKDAQDMALLSKNRVMIARSGLGKEAEGRLELRTLDRWEPAPYAVLPLRPPIVLDAKGQRALVHAKLLEGYETSLAVVDLDAFEIRAHLPFTAPFAFFPAIAPFDAPDGVIVATLPFEVGDEILIAKQSYVDVLDDRMMPAGKDPGPLRAPVILDYKKNRVVRVLRETPGARHVFTTADGEGLFTITEKDVFIRRTHVATGGLEWDVPIGRNRPGDLYTPYAAALQGQKLAVGVYDRHIEVVDALRGDSLARVSLGDENRSRIDALAWHPSGRLLAAGLASGGVLLVWVAAPGTPWRRRVFQSSVKSTRALAFHPTEPKLLVLGGDGYLREWLLLADELGARSIPPRPSQAP